MFVSSNLTHYSMDMEVTIRDTDGKERTIVLPRVYKYKLKNGYMNFYDYAGLHAAFKNDRVLQCRKVHL